jgi:acid stress-induced BolA-like protein IbaG/YrbA
MRLNTINDNINDNIRAAIQAALPTAEVMVSGGNGHFTLEVTHEDFKGKSPVAQQRLVLSAIKHLMAGDAAPVHAVDSLKVHVR